MNTGKYIFAQVTSFISVNDFNKSVARYRGNNQVKHFTCWHQLMCMVFGQLSNCDSLTDLAVGLTAQRSKWYHLGMGTGLSKSNLAHANEHRDWRIFADFATQLISEATILCRSNSDVLRTIKDNVYAVDSTTIDLCLEVFWWADFRKYKAAIKLHTQFDVKAAIPTFIDMTEGLVHDVNFLDKITFEVGAFYVLDKGYVDFKRLYLIHQAGAFFVTRAKDNMNCRRLYSARVNKKKGIQCDQTIKLNNYNSNKHYPEKIRRIKYYDEETGNEFDFITNNFSLPAIKIALLYKHRWSVELFFKWIKQHLKIKTFWGYSENAVRVQVYSAIITYLAIAIMKEKLKLKQSNYEIIQILNFSLIDKIPVQQLFQEYQLQNSNKQNCNQLKINL
ncbi:MAG: IS4 family transposase [Flavobacteriales bacterium]